MKLRTDELFRRVPPDHMRRVRECLQMMRDRWPEYKDADLLFYLLTQGSPAQGTGPLSIECPRCGRTSPK